MKGLEIKYVDKNVFIRILVMNSFKLEDIFEYGYRKFLKGN